MIDEYLRIFCLLIIDDLNEKHQGIPVRSEALKRVSSSYSETDLVFRIGYFFRERVTFESKESKGDIHGHNDIYVKSKDYKIEVKFAKSHKSIGGYESNKLPWDQVIPDFTWLKNEILQGHKGKRAFVIGWFNTDELNKLIQIGVGKGQSPKIGLDKEPYFPFINFNESTLRTDTVGFDYEKVEKPQIVKIPDFDGIMNCLFLGNQEDLFHIAIYY